MADGYRVAVDWDGDGTFTGTHDDVTDDVLGSVPITYSYGRDQGRQLSPPAVGRIGFSLCNTSRIYSPENTSSPLAANFNPSAPVKVEATMNAVTYPLGTGRIEEYTVHPDRGDRSVDITALDGLAQLDNATISTAVYQARRTGDLIGIVLDEAGWTGPRDLDVGATFIPWWWAEGMSAFTAVAELLQAEGPPSIAYVTPDGTFTFRDRHHRLLNAASLTSQATFSAVAVDCDAPAVTGLDYTAPFEYNHGARDIINTITTDVEERRPDDTAEVVWSSEATFNLSIGESIQLRAHASDPFRDAQDLEEDTDYTHTGPGTLTVSLSRRSGQSLVITMLAVGGATTITSVQLRARPVPVARTVQVTQDDSVSIGKHGRRSPPDALPSWTGQHDAHAVGQLLLAYYADRRPIVSMRVVSADTEHREQVLSRTISDRIRIVNGELGMDSDFHIERVDHTIRRINEGPCPGPVHAVVLGCEQTVAPAENPFTFDKTGAGFDDGVFDPTAADDPEKIFIFDHPTQGQFDLGVFAT